MVDDDKITQLPIKTSFDNSLWVSSNHFKKMSGNDEYYINISLYSKFLCRHSLTANTSYYLQMLFKYYYLTYDKDKSGLNRIISTINDNFKIRNKRISVKNIEIRCVNHGEIVYDIDLLYT